MTDQREHGQQIMRITHAVICGRTLEETEVAFAALCIADLEAAVHLADLLTRASPDSAPLWQAIIDHIAKAHPTKKDDDDRQSGPAMSTDDTQDTAGGLAEHMGWLDVETDDKE